MAMCKDVWFMDRKINVVGKVERKAIPRMVETKNGPTKVCGAFLKMKLVKSDLHFGIVILKEFKTVIQYQSKMGMQEYFEERNIFHLDFMALYVLLAPIQIMIRKIVQHHHQKRIPKYQQKTITPHHLKIHLFLLLVKKIKIYHILIWEKLRK